MAAFAFALASSATLRVASLDLCADEYLMLLARDDQVAAVSRLSQDPAESADWRRARRFAAYGGRVESLLPLRPTTLLAVGSPGGKSTLAVARRLGWRTLVLPFPEDPEQVAHNVAKVAALLGNAQGATRWLSAFARVKQSAPKTVDAAFLSGGGLTVDPSGPSAAWMRLAGYRQVRVDGGRMTLERLALRPPATLLISDYRSGQLSLGQRWMDHPLVRNSKSAKVHTDGRPWTCAGPSMLPEIVRLRRTR